MKCSSPLPTRYRSAGRTLLALAAVFAIAASAKASEYSTFGQNHISAGFGTTVTDTFDDREYSFDTAGSVNFVVAPQVDAGVSVGYSRISGEAGGMGVRSRSTSAMFRARIFGEASPRIRPAAGVTVGMVDSQMRMGADSDSDNALTFGVTGGVEYMIFERTALLFTVDWRHTGRMFEGALRTPERQSVSFGNQVSHFFTDDIFGFAVIAFPNTSNNTAFRVGLGKKF